MSNYNANKKYHYLYKTTNLVNGRFYFGMHSTNNLDDEYLGSGTLLRKSILKYGKESFKKEIIVFCDTREELAKREHDLIENYLGTKNCINLKPGGKGGFCNEEHARKFHAAGGATVRKLLSKRHQQRLKVDRDYNEFWHQRCRESNVKSFLGRHHTEETKLKMSASHKGKGIGRNNSQYGKMWITNGVESRSVEKGSNLPEGWRKGRVINPSKGMQ